ncbi:MAG TPA: hypothetical protein VJ831_02080 [Jatrophihabitantaceae bacterium]|nr:hypothetical protein [Jatrophihabitantaceae bacterium]
MAGGRIAVMSPNGAVRRDLGTMPTVEGDEVNAIDVSPDGKSVLVSVLNDKDGACAASVYSVGDDRVMHPFLNGAAASFSPDGRSVALLRYSPQGEFCYRTRLVVRSLTDGSERTTPLPGGPTMEGNPPEWPVNWSPDGRRIALVRGPHATASVITVHTWTSTSFNGASRAGAPVFLSNSDVALYTGCCAGSQQAMTRFHEQRVVTKLFSVTSPVRSIRRDRGGAGVFFTTEPFEPGVNTLWHWDGSQLTALAPDVLVTSG